MGIDKENKNVLAQKHFHNQFCPLLSPHAHLRVELLVNNKSSASQQTYLRFFIFRKKKYTVTWVHVVKFNPRFFTQMMRE